MTYHDHNRLKAHLPEWLRERNLFLDLTTQLMAGHIASTLNNDSGDYSISAETLALPERDNPHSKRGTKKTWLTHMATLEQVGIFTTKRLRQRQARFWELAIPCPPSCVGKDFENHNSPQRRKQLEQQSKVVDNSNQKSNLGDQKSKDYSTNREYIDIDDIEIQFSKLELGQFIAWTISQLTELNDQHNSLLGYIDTNKAEVETKALAILKKRTPALPGKYLYKVVTDTPAELFKHLISKTNAKASSKVVATIHTANTVKARVTFSKVKGYMAEKHGVELTEATKYYLGKKLELGQEITWKDLVVCELIEKHGLRLRAEGTLATGNFDLWLSKDGKPKVHYGDQTNFVSDNTTAEQHLEYLNQQLSDLYERLPDNTTLEAYDLENWLINNYTVDDDLTDFYKAYPTKPEGMNWDLNKAAEELLLAYQRGLTLEDLTLRAEALPRNKPSWAEHKQHPHTWLREQHPTKPALATNEPIDSNTASNLGELVQALSKP